jgi:hypothetical protein
LAISIPVSNFIGKKLDEAWRTQTGLEPPSAESAKRQRKDIKKARKAGDEVPEPRQPGTLDAVMWAGLSAMSVVLVKAFAERASDEAYRFFAGKNPKPEPRDSAALSGDIGKAQGLAAVAVRGTN